MEFVRQMGGEIHVQSGRSRGNLFWFAVDLRVSGQVRGAPPEAIQVEQIRTQVADRAVVAAGG